MPDETPLTEEELAIEMQDWGWYDGLDGWSPKRRNDPGYMDSYRAGQRERECRLEYEAAERRAAERRAEERRLEEEAELEAMMEAERQAAEAEAYEEYYRKSWMEDE
ncbi:MAG: hypothetical protein C4521_07685 [Actinobacteria bacterium]|nr:MAG: hypothetical protein C4521_07685 [Actinomycetota bacterium]